MAQSRDDYWWSFIQKNEEIYLLLDRDVNQDISSNIYESLNRLLDYIFGYNSQSYTSGILYGIKVVPYGQNILVSSDTNISQSSTFDLNYNILCVNKEFSSFPNGQPILTSGALSVNDNLYSTGETPTSIHTFAPPLNLKNVILTSSIYLDISTFLNYLSSNHTIANSISLSILEIFNEYNNQYILENCEFKFDINNDYSKYERNINNSEYFPQNNYLNICKVVYRISDTTDINDMKYEYYIIDTREINGYFGLKQIDMLNIISNLSNNINFTQNNAVDIIKDVFSYLFNDMSGTDGEFTPDFITYWNAYLSPDSVSTTIQDLYNELGP